MESQIGRNPHTVLQRVEEPEGKTWEQYLLHSPSTTFSQAHDSLWPQKNLELDWNLVGLNGAKLFQTIDLPVEIDQQQQLGFLVIPVTSLQ